MMASLSPTDAPRRGIVANRQQFLLQTLQVLFVGLIIGMERNVLPAMSRGFGVAPGAFFFLASFVISFGLIKGVLNFVAGGLSDRIGRKRVLFFGWLAAIPIPLLIFFGPNWWWIIGANAFLGVNQAFTWTMTVTSQIDLAGSQERGLAVGINEAVGYVGVGLAGVATGYLALAYGPRRALLYFGLLIIIVALILLLWIADTIQWVHMEHAESRGRPGARSPANAGPWATFMRVSFTDTTYRALCQGGVANKVADTLVWVLFPIYFHLRGLSVVRIGWITGIYAITWGLSQLWTGHLADRVGRKPPIVAGFALLASGLAATALAGRFPAWIATATVMGLGMALLYPNLIAAMSDVAAPLERGRVLGTYRYWRDTGYAIGALILGWMAQTAGSIAPAIWLTAGIVALAGLWIALAVKETHPQPHRQPG
ncbi:MAG: MFS transporter [Acidobacteriaceae bacterium]